MSKSPYTTYYGAKNNSGYVPQDWWNHLHKDKQAPAGFPVDGMLSNNLLNGGYDKKKLIAKYGSEWDNLSADQQDKLMKEDMDK